MSKKSTLTLLAFACGLQIALTPLPATAYVYLYHPGVPEVETDTTSIGGQPQPSEQGQAPVPYQPQPAAVSDETAPAQPVAPVEPAPLQKPVVKKLARPFFTDTSLEPETAEPAVQAPAPAPAAAPVAPSSSILRQMPSGYGASPQAAFETAPVLTPVDEPRTPPAQPVAKPPLEVEDVGNVPAAVPLTGSAAPAAEPETIKPKKTVAVQTDPVQAAMTKPVDAKPVAIAPAPSSSPASGKTGTTMASLTPDETKTPVPAAVAPAEQEPAAAPAPQKAAADKSADKSIDKPIDKPSAVPTLADLSLDFDGTSSALTPDAQKKLDALAKQMQGADSMRVQIRGFAKGDDGQSSARRMALSRALVVRSYLMDKGVKAVRLDVRALGSETDQTPIDRVDLVFIR